MTEINRAIINKIEEETDSENLLEIAFKLNEQIDVIVNEYSGKWEIPDLSSLKNMILIGLGGSAIGGDLLRTAMIDQLKIPAVMLRDYTVPAFVGNDTLCLCASYSGNTEETLAAYKECRDRGARIITVSTGGKLKEMAIEDGNIFCEVPKGFQPRAALGISFTAQLVILMKAGLLKSNLDELKSASNMLKQTAGKWMNWRKIDENPPLELAAKLTDKLPVIYGVAGWTSTMAYRWRCQFNENAKKYAASTEFPELNHNEIVGWEGNEDFYKDMFVIFLRTGEDHPRTQARMDLTAKIISEKAPVMEIKASGDNRIEKIYYLILFGDLLSIYVAYLNKKDPADISVIHRLKRELAKIN